MLLKRAADLVEAVYGNTHSNQVTDSFIYINNLKNACLSTKATNLESNTCYNKYVFSSSQCVGHAAEEGGGHSRGSVQCPATPQSAPGPAQLPGPW